jgi:conjugative transfer signal peptidase TraF
MKIRKAGKPCSRTGLFERLRTTEGRLVRNIALAITALLLGLFLIPGKLGLRVNATPSLPVGFYIETTAPSSLIEFCPPEPAASFAAQRGYRNEGSCPDGASPFLKPVVARAGDTVDLTPAGIVVNSRFLPFTAPRATDTKGRALQHYPFGRYSVEPGTVWVASSYNPRSFDSRYFGPILVSSLRAHLRALWTL